MLFYTVLSRQGTTVLIFMWSRQHSPQPGLHGDKPLSVFTLPYAFASLTLGPLLSLCDSLSPQSHPHWACDLIRPKSQGLLDRGDRGVGGWCVEEDQSSFSSYYAERLDQYIFEHYYKCVNWLSSQKSLIFTCHVWLYMDIFTNSVIRWFSGWLLLLGFCRPCLFEQALGWHSRHCRVLLNCPDPRPRPEWTALDRGRSHCLSFTNRGGQIR